MSQQETVALERLSCGMDAAFVRQPHYRTHAARLVINSGSVHESEGQEGAAHFFEHMAFQGTNDLPTEPDIHGFARK